jgi:lipopolysaccharide biosynthesis glycosyltransferase
MDDRVHVCYCVNRKVLLPLCVSAHSAASSLGGRNLSIWVFHEDYTSENKQAVRDVLRPFDDVELTFREVSLADLAGLPGLHGEVIPLAKPLIPRLLEGEVRRVVYLDADTIVVGGLDDLYHHSLEGYVVGAVSYETLGEAYTRDFFASQDLDLDEKAFNSGVLLIDVDAWNERGLTSDVLSFLKANASKYDGADQASLNVIFHKRFLPLRIRYNKRANPGRKLEDKHVQDGILHFVGIPKPWDPGGRWLNRNYPHYKVHRERAQITSRSVWGKVRDTGWRRMIKGLRAGLRVALSR